MKINIDDLRVFHADKELADNNPSKERDNETNTKDCSFSINQIPVKVTIEIVCETTTDEISLKLEDGQVHAHIEMCGNYSKSDLQTIINALKTAIDAAEQMERE